ncbi:uncharacterized protein LOC111069032 [Drosophila obscura]|uniref:uncharacterized protein LOC111069032 n=1 Tax=Drosophila obscura TaxID=7282 RepID=UPI000BA08CA9|nr:uncharacterized protein LOC111069032 [Drosophila obscura]XP_022214602.1 uncharacterized protein LOC111069032 [Drosophila obscura]
METMDVMAMSTPDDGYHCNYDSLNLCIAQGRAKLVLVAQSAPDWMRAELKAKAVAVGCWYLEYERSLIVIINSDGQTLYARCVAFTDSNIANQIIFLENYYLPDMLYDIINE